MVFSWKTNETLGMERRETTLSPSTSETYAGATSTPIASRSTARTRKSPVSVRRTKISPFFSLFRVILTRMFSAPRARAGDRRNPRTKEARIGGRKVLTDGRKAGGWLRRAHRFFRNDLAAQGKQVGLDIHGNPGQVGAHLPRNLCRISPECFREKVPAGKLPGEHRLPSRVLPRNDDGMDDEVFIPRVPHRYADNPLRHPDRVDLPLALPLQGLDEYRQAEPDGEGYIGPFPLPRAGDLLDEEPVRLFPLRRGNPDPRPQDPLLLAFDGHDFREKDEIVRRGVPVLPLRILGPFGRAYLDLDLLVSLVDHGDDAAFRLPVEHEPDRSDPPFPGAGKAGENQETQENPKDVNSFLHPEKYTSSVLDGRYFIRSSRTSALAPVYETEEPEVRCAGPMAIGQEYVPGFAFSSRTNR